MSAPILRALRPSRPITETDMDAAARALEMARRSDRDLSNLRRIHAASLLFASTVIVAACDREITKRAAVRAETAKE